MLIRWSHVSSGTKRRSVRSTIASKDAEIAALKANMSELYARYNALGRRTDSSAYAILNCRRPITG